MRALGIALLTLVLAASAAFAFIFSGAYNVAATAGHSRAVDWLLHTAMHQSVSVRARNIEVPSQLDDPELIGRGALQYEAHCAVCHLSPARHDAPLFDGLTPQPPKLAAAGHWGPALLYWITKHGIKMTGMPAWAPTLSDEQIWEIVAFLQVLPGLSETDYLKLQEGEGVHLDHPPARHSH
jgi:mono/diheme cytochrome c family protein